VALIVGAAVLAAAAAAAVPGRSKLSKATPVVGQAAQSVKADVQEIRESARR
jgi:hypothetical protein